MLIGRREFVRVLPGSVVSTSFLGHSRPLTVLAIDDLVECNEYARMRLTLAYDGGLTAVSLHRSSNADPDDSLGFVLRLVLQ